MELEGIAVFIKVVQTGSFSQAARLLKMPNSTVSARVAQLERRLGVTLLNRTTRKLSLTDAGRAFFEKSQKGLELLEAAEADLAGAVAEPSGLLRVTCPVDVGHTLLPKIVCRYLDAFPRTRVDLLVTNRVVDLVAESVDLAIRAGELSDSSFRTRRFQAGQMGLWASPKYLKQHGLPKDPKDLERHSFIIFRPYAERARVLVNGKTKSSYEMNGRVVADDLQTTAAFAMQGEGVAFLPTFICAEEVKRGRLVRVLPGWVREPVMFSFVYPAHRYTSPALKAFIEIASETVRAEME